MYTHLRELLKGKLEELGYPSAEFGVHSLRAEGPQQQQEVVYQTGYLKSMAAGGRKQLKMAMWKTPWSSGY